MKFRICSCINPNPVKWTPTEAETIQIESVWFVVYFRNKEPFFEYYKTIITVWAWSDPIKPERLYDRFHYVPITSYVQRMIPLMSLVFQDVIRINDEMYWTIRNIWFVLNVNTHVIRFPRSVYNERRKRRRKAHIPPHCTSLNGKVCIKILQIVE